MLRASLNYAYIFDTEECALACLFDPDVALFRYNDIYNGHRVLDACSCVLPYVGDVQTSLFIGSRPSPLIFQKVSFS